MCTYLAKRGSIYYFRRAVPDHLRAIIGRAEWMQSLQTKDRPGAKLQLPLHMQRTDREIRDAEAKLRAGWRPPVRDDGGLSPAELEAMEEASRRASAEDAAAMMEAAVFGERLAGEIADIEAATETPLYALARETAAAVLVAQRAVERERGAQWDEAARAFAQSGELAAKLTRKPEGPTEAAAQPKPATAIMAAFDAYARATEQRASSTRNMRPHMQRLVAFLGHDDLLRVTSDDLLRWIEELRETPGKRCAMLAAKTIRDGYFATARALFTWAMEQRMRPDNPALGIRVRGRRAPRLRDRGFTDAEARTVLQAAWAYTNPRQKACYVRAIKWLPWIMAYTGARGGEIAQLRAEDILEAEGMWTIRITPEAGGVKTDEARQVPMHSHLVELGLPDMAKQVGSGPLFYEPGGSWRTATKPVEKVGDFVRALGITISQPTHGWRHRFKTDGRRWDMDGAAVDAMQGHAPATVGRTYGDTVLVWQARSLEKLPRYEVSGPDAA